MKNPSIEQMLQDLKPRGPQAALREQVVAAVADDVLRSERESRWWRRSGIAVAAMILFGIALNSGLSRMADRRLARLLAPTAKSTAGAVQIAETNRGETTAQWLWRVVWPFRAADDAGAAYTAYCETLKRATNEIADMPKPSPRKVDSRGAGYFEPVSHSRGSMIA